MSAGAPWSVKGIDPKAREVAKDLARRSGMTLGAWLNRVILEDDLPEEIGGEEDFAGHRPPEPPRLRAVPGGLQAGGEAPPPDLARVAAALDRLTLRIEASETRTGLAVNGIEHSVRQALARIETAEREQHALAARIEGGLAEAAVEQSYVGERVRRLEEEPAGPRSPEALRALDAGRPQAEPEVVAEAVLARLGERLVEAEARTTAALEDLKFALGALDHRVVGLERSGVGDAAEARFGALAHALTERLDEVRAEVAGKLASAGGSGDVEARLAEMAEHVRAAERRSTQAVEAIGKQVLSMADAVSRKLTEVDQRGAAAIDQVGSEIARIAGAVELRLARGEQAQAEAFEKITADFTRATEALTERLTAGEQRNAHAIESVGDQVAALTERIEARHDRAASDVAERLRQSEARTADLLDQARTWIRPATQETASQETATYETASYQAAAEAVAAEPHVLGPPPEPEPEMASFGDELFSRAEAEPGSTTAAVAAAEDEPRPETVTAAWRRIDLDVPEPQTPEAFAPIEGDDEDEDIFAPDPADPPPALGPQLSTREVIDQARAAARAAKVAEGGQTMNMRAKIGGASAGRLFTGFGGKPRRANTALQTALMVAGGAAFLSVGAAGITLMQGPQPRQEQAELSPYGVTPRAAVALSSPSLTATGSTADAVEAATPVFTRVKADVEAGVPGALAQLRALAMAGHAQAQLYLAQLYDAGEAGLPRDPIEARRLTALAADSGDAQAMHNLGVYLFRGEGGPADYASAAEWFRKAAAAGVVESQFNLGLLYQSGSGVPKDPEKARHWFAAAAARGDADARKALADLDGRRAPAAAPVRAPEPRHAEPPHRAAVAPASSSPNVRQAQAILTRLGYYEGPADGLANEAYKVALFRYQQDQRDQAAGPKPYAR